MINIKAGRIKKVRKCVERKRKDTKLESNHKFLKKNPDTFIRILKTSTLANHIPYLIKHQNH